MYNNSRGFVQVLLSKAPGFSCYPSVGFVDARHPAFVRVWRYADDDGPPRPKLTVTHRPCELNALHPLGDDWAEDGLVTVALKVLG